MSEIARRKASHIALCVDADVEARLRGAARRLEPGTPLHALHWVCSFSSIVPTQAGGTRQEVSRWAATPLSATKGPR